MIRYRYQFPIAISLFRWGVTIALQHPIYRIYPRPDPRPEDSMLIYIGMFDEDD
jgi:hypothetical protein